MSKVAGRGHSWHLSLKTGAAMSARPQIQFVNPSLIPTLSSSLTQNSPERISYILPPRLSSSCKLFLTARMPRQGDGVGVGRRGCSCVRYTGIARNTDDGGPWAGILSTLEALLPTKQPHLIPLVSHTIATILCLCHAKERAGEGCAEILHLLREESWVFKKRRL